MGFLTLTCQLTSIVCYGLLLFFPRLSFTGTRIVYERKFLLQCRNSPHSKSPPCNLPTIPGVTEPEEIEEKSRAAIPEEQHSAMPKENIAPGANRGMSASTQRYVCRWCSVFTGIGRYWVGCNFTVSLAHLASCRPIGCKLNRSGAGKNDGSSHDDGIISR